MATCAFHRPVGAFERESGECMGLQKRSRVSEIASVVTRRAVEAQLAAVGVLVAAGAGPGEAGELERPMAGGTRHRPVAVLEGESIVGVSEFGGNAGGAPSIGGMAGDAFQCEFAVRALPTARIGGLARDPADRDESDPTDQQPDSEPAPRFPRESNQFRYLTVEFPFRGKQGTS
jgi:hypothetical protein